MNLRSLRRREEPEINLIPLIDILFFLLLFFMLSSTFERVAALKVDLPKSSQQPAQAEKKQKIDITIDAQGNFYVDGKQTVNTRLDTLMRALRLSMSDKADKTDLTLVITADAKTPHQAVVTAMDAARRSGLERVSIATSAASER